MRKPTYWFATWSDTNEAVQVQKMARGFNFGFRKKRDCTIYVAKSKALISFAGKSKTDLRVFVFAYAKPWFSLTLLKFISTVLIILDVDILVSFYFCQSIFSFIDQM